jgi:hypothetical protein
MSELQENIDGIPNISGSEKIIEKAKQTGFYTGKPH